MSNTRNKLPSRFVRKLGSTPSDYIQKPGITFSKELKNACNEKQKKLISDFENRIANTKTKIPIYQKFFKYGTFRITKPGYYILKENIVFDPVNQFPTKEQQDIYPQGKDGPYHLGFFAALTVETDDVIVDLNGFSIKQSKRHNLLQRFFSNIELANSPFIPNQGPHSFIKNYRATHNCLIANGNLDNSSHHGIHGNENSNIILINLNIYEYEVAGIALNGSVNSIISNCKIIGKNKNIPVLSFFSQALFSARALENYNKTDTIIYQNLDKDLQNAYDEIMNGKKQTTYFENKTGKYDGNMYGIVLNVNGVVINRFLTSRNNTKGNEGILLFNNSVNKVDSHPVEVVALPNPIKNDNVSSIAYGKKRMVGAFGDVFDIEKVLNSENSYQGNSLSEAQFYLSSPELKKGTANIAPYVVEWAHSEEQIPADWQFVPEGDSMGHFMKGNIGLFISGGKDINVADMIIKNVNIDGNDVGTSYLLKDNQRFYQGANAYGILMTGSEDINLNNVIVEEIKTNHPKGIAKKIELLN